MTTTSLLAILLLTLSLSPLCIEAQAPFQLIDLDQFGLATDTFARATAEEPYREFVADGLRLPSFYDTVFNYWSGGWALSTVRDTNDRTFNNLYAAAEVWEDLGTYAIGQNGGYLLTEDGYDFYSGLYNNTAYVVGALREGTMFSREFGVDTLGNTGYPDSLILAISYYFQDTLTYAERYPLADFRAADDAGDYIEDRWPAYTLEFPPIRWRADSVVYRMYSSDNGQYGNNTPDFFAAKDFVVVDRASSVSPLAPALAEWVAKPSNANAGVSLGESGALPGRITVIDAAGRWRFTRDGFAPGTELDVSSLTPGRYWAVFVGRDGAQARATFTVQR